MTAKDSLKEMINKELVSKLISCGYNSLVQQLLDHGNYTRTGRLNVSAVSRKLKLCCEDVKKMMLHCRKLLHDDILDME